MRLIATGSKLVFVRCVGSAWRQRCRGLGRKLVVQDDADELSLFLSHRTALVDYAGAIIKCRAGAEDVVQEAYIRFSAAAGSAVRSPGGRIVQPLAYLYRIVRNLALDLARRQALEGRPQSCRGLEALPSPVPNPEHDMLYRDELRVLAHALAELPERTRIAFAMHRLQRCTLQEVADHLGVSVVRAHQLVKEAVLHGARKLDEHGE
jgi:RNA polymerase sigma factor (sigma-70 family)